jgi:Thrombospondin type 3 repeat/Bacterial TSP3 repeat
MTARPRHLRVAIPVSLALLAAVLALRPAPAHASVCFPELDTPTFQWFPNAQGAANGGRDVAGARANAFSPGGTLSVNGALYAPTASTGGCDFPRSIREMVTPEQVLSGLTVSREVFVTDGGGEFARQLDVLRNLTGSPITVTLDWKSTYGAGAATQVFATSSGAIGAATAADSWAAVDNGTGTTGPVEGVEIWDSTSTAKRRAADTVTLANGSGAHTITYTGLVVAPGSTVMLMHLLVTRLDRAGAISAANTLAAGGPEVFAGLSGTEGDEILNWNGSDIDGDGVGNSGDNCPTVANANQSDIDGDHQGDACDDDIDGDGLSNATEASIGTNPASADSDGDKVADGGDPCPLVFGKGTTGCPAGFDGAFSFDKGASASNASKLKRKAFLKGARYSANTTRSASLKFELLGSAGKGTTAKAYNLVLASKSLGAGTGTRSVTLKPSKRVKYPERSFKVQLRVTATDSNGAQLTIKRTITVK